MAIVIKEIILSDSVSKFMEKVNFNFDQLLLAGGGPPGLQGPVGLIGPAGPKGDPGNKWYVGCTISATGVYNAGAAMTGLTAYAGDLFLQNQDCAGLQDYPLGEVLVFNELTQIWDDTGLNIEGPTGPTGATGTSIEFIMFPGATNAFSAWAPLQSVGSGSTANFVFLKGDVSDTMGGLADRDGGSRDTLWLGGHRAAINKQSEWSYANTPKLIVNPKNGFNIPAATFFQTPGAGGGIAGAGVALGWEEPQNNAIGPSATTGTMSWSNMFVDSLHNLHLTNFTNFNSASQSTDGTASNIVNISGMARTEIHGVGYTANNVTGHMSVGVNLQTDAWNQMGALSTDWDGAFIKAGAAQSKITLQTEDTGLITFAGGGGYQGNNDNPNAIFVSNRSNSNNSVDSYRITITPDAPTALVDINKAMFLQSGFVTTNSTQRGYIGIGAGNNPGESIVSRPRLSIVATSTDASKALVGEPINTNIDDVFQSTTINDTTGIGGGFNDSSIDIVGRLRMREAKAQYLTGTTGDVMIAVDSSGVAGWTASSNVGGWKADSNCTSRLIVSQQGTRFPSTIAGDSTGPIGELNYSRMDIAVNNGGPGANTAEADLFFTTYETPASTRQFGIQYNFDDLPNTGQIQIKSYTTVNECPSSLTSQDATGAVPILTGDYYGRIIIGQTPAGATNGPWLTTGSQTATNRTLTLESNTTRSNNETNASLLLRNSLSDASTFDSASPQITFSPGLESAGDNGFDDGSTFEVYRDTHNNALGDLRIRFHGTGMGPDPAGGGDNGVDGTVNKTSIVGASGGAHVMMIADMRGATSANNKEASTLNYYEINHRDFFIDRMRVFWKTGSPGSSTDRDQEYQSRYSRSISLHQWGTAGSGWNSQVLSPKQVRFQGSRAGTDMVVNGGSGDNSPGLLYTDSANCPAAQADGRFTPGNSQRATRLGTWHSPTSIIRFTPLQMSQASSDLGDDSFGMAMLEFDIQMGIFFTGGNAEDYQNGNPMPTYVPLPGPGSNYYSDNSVSDDPKIQGFRVKLNTRLGWKLASPDSYTLDSMKENAYQPIPSTAGGSDGNAFAGSSHDVFTTQWYVGAVKPMYGNGGGSGDSWFGSSNTYKSFPWGDGIKRWKDSDQGGNPGSAGNGIRLFDNMAINPTSADWGANQILSLDLNMSSSQNKLLLASDTYADYAGRFTTGTCLWRVNQTLNSSGDVNASYIEFYYPPQQYDGWQTAVVPGKDGSGSTNVISDVSKQRNILPTRMGYADGTSGWDTSTDGVEWAQNYGWIPNVPMFQNKWLNAIGAKDCRIDAEALMTTWTRNRNFYQMLGISFSGNQMIRISSMAAKVAGNNGGNF